MGPYPMPKPVYMSTTETRGRKLRVCLVAGSRPGSSQFTTDKEEVAAASSSPALRYTGRRLTLWIIKQIQS